MITRIVEDHNKKLALKIAEDKGWELHDMRMLTNNPDDDYLMVSLAYIPSKKEWAVHTFNSSRKGFYNGFYTKNELEALIEYRDRK